MADGDAMKVWLPLFVLADEVTVLRDGRLNLMGAAPEFWTVPLGSPASVRGAIVLATSREHADRPIPLGLRLVSEGGGVLAEVGLSVQSPPTNPAVFVAGAAVNRPIPFEIGAVFEVVGPHRLELFGYDGALIATLPFSLRAV